MHAKKHSHWTGGGKHEAKNKIFQGSTSKAGRFLGYRMYGVDYCLFKEESSEDMFKGINLAKLQKYHKVQRMS